MQQYRTEMLDAGITMPAAWASMPMPSYGYVFLWIRPLLAGTFLYEDIRACL
jgi:hypothetical protein